MDLASLFPLNFHMNFRIGGPFSGGKKKIAGILIRIPLNREISLGDSVILSNLVWGGLLCNDK